MIEWIFLVFYSFILCLNLIQHLDVEEFKNKLLMINILIAYDFIFYT